MSDNSLRSGPSQAVVIATSVNACPEFADSRPRCLMPLADKSALQQALEVAVRFGARRVNVVVSDDADQITAFVDSGSRWGIDVSTHLVRDEHHPYDGLQRCIRDCDDDESTLILHADTFPGDLSPDSVPEALGGCAVFANNDQWASAAVLTAGYIRSTDFARCDRNEFGQRLMETARENGATIQVAAPLSVVSGRALLDSQRRLLSGDFPEMMEHLRTAEDGVWIGRNTRVHPTSRIIAPVMIGANCDLSRRTDIGPNVVLSEGCLIDEGVLTQDSLVMPFSGVGEGLELRDVIVSGRRVFNARFNAAIDIRDDVLVGDLSSRSLRDGLAALVSRTASLVLIAVTWPVLGMILGVMKIVRPGSEHKRYTVVRTPARERELLWEKFRVRQLTTGREWIHEHPGASAMWRDMFARVLPGLSAVVRGRLRLFGTSTRSPEELHAVADHWRELLLATPCGLISEALIQYGPDCDADQKCSADVWYAVADSRMKRSRLLLRYLKSLVCGPLAVSTGDARLPVAATKHVSMDATPDFAPSIHDEVHHGECV